MRSLSLAVALLVAFALSGCGTVRALVGPDPALVAATPAIVGALDRDSAAHPEFKPANDDGKKAIGDYTNPEPISGPGLLDGLSGLLSAAGLTALAGLATAAANVWRSRKTAAAVDQHAALIDSVTPDSADWAARAKAKTPV